MRTWPVFFSTVAAPLVLVSCTPNVQYYASSYSTADGALLAFGEANAKCQIWTNWQKMCSRTGEGGRSICILDVDRPVSPSEPFCASSDESRARPDLNNLSAKQQASALRFCSRQDARRSPTGEKNEQCAFSSDRPFNGYRLAARLHPWCGQWNEAVTRRPVCSSKGERKTHLAKCGDLARGSDESKFGYYCAVPNLPTWCRKANGLGIESESVGQKQTLPVAERQEAYAVRGISCEIWR